MHPAAAHLLRRQHGAATVAQLVEACGATRDQVNGWARRGHLERVGRGVVVAPGAPRTAHLTIMVAALRCGPAARVVGPAALGLLGVRGFAVADSFAILLPAGTHRRTGMAVPLLRDPHPDDGIVPTDGIPLPPPSRVAVEMARFTDEVGLRTAIDAARWVRRPSTAGLLSGLEPLPSRYRPAAAVRRLVRAGHLDLESEPERLVVGILGDEFGPVETQVWVTPRRRVDVLLRALGIVVEYLGHDHRTAAGRSADRARDRELASVGLRVLPVYAEDLAHPARLRARLWRMVRDDRVA